MSLLRRSLLCAALPAATVSAAAPLRVRFPSGRDANDRRGKPLEELFVLALSAAGIEVEIEAVAGMTQLRRLQELRAERLDAAYVSSASASPRDIPVLRRPLRRGLLGVRLLLARRALAPALSKVKQVEELRAWRLGYGSGWSDLEMQRRLGFPLVIGNTYSGLFRMLASGRFDWMHRGLSEVWDEVDNPELVPEGLVVVPGLALFYPLDTFFCVSPQRAGWLDALDKGLDRLERDGRYARWFDAHYGQALTRAAMPGRRVLPLPGYELMPGASLADFDVLRRAPGRP